MKGLWPSAALVALIMAVAVPVAAAPFAYPAPVQDGFPQGPVPEVSAKSWILYDESTDTILASVLPDEERAMASTTKIMTGLLTLERSDPNEIVTVSNNAAATGEKEIDLVAGEKLTMAALFKSLMVHSANDSATAIAEHISGTVTGFVDLMNERARELGLTHTSFANPHGLDAPNHYSSARDLLTLGRIAMSTPGFADVVRSKIVVMPPDPDGSLRRGTTTDLMLEWYPGAIGIKTGFTAQALLTYVGAAERDGRRLYVVVLGSEGVRGHFVDAIELLDYGFHELGYFGGVGLGSPYVSAKMRMTPDPLLLLGETEAYLHLSNLGLTLDDPGAIGQEPGEEPVAIQETTRRSEPPPGSIWEALGYWLRSVG